MKSKPTTPYNHIPREVAAAANISCQRISVATALVRARHPLREINVAPPHTIATASGSTVRRSGVCYPPALSTKPKCGYLGHFWTRITMAPSTSHMAPSTYHMVPSTYHMAPSVYPMVPSASHMAPSTYHMVPSTYHMAPSTSHMAPMSFRIQQNQQQLASGSTVRRSVICYPPALPTKPKSVYWGQFSTRSTMAPSTSYMALSTSHMAPTTSHKRPITSHMAQSTSHIAPSTSHMAPSTSHMTPSTSHMAPSTSQMCLRIQQNKKKLTGNQMNDSSKLYPNISGAKFETVKDGSGTFLVPKPPAKTRANKKPTAKELAIDKKLSGWKVHHLSTHFDDLATSDFEFITRYSSLLKALEKDKDIDEDLYRIAERIRANFRTSIVVSNKLNEAKAKLFQLIDKHKPRVAEIIKNTPPKKRAKKF